MREDVERVRELQAAAADPRMIGLPQRRSRASSATAVPALVHADAVDADVAGEDQRARAFARRRQAARDEQEIEARLGQRPSRSRASVVARGSSRRCPRGGRRGPPRRARPRRASTHSAARRARSVEAVERGERRLAGGRVLAGGLAERLVRPFDVEHVVDDLEREAEVARVVVDRVDASRRRRRRGSRRACTAARISAPVLRACMSSSAGVVERAPSRFRTCPAAGEIDRPVRRPCPPRRPPAASTAIARRRAVGRRCRGRRRDGRRRRRARARRRLGQQAVAGEDRQRRRRRRRASSAGRAAASSLSIAGRSSWTSE